MLANFSQDAKKRIDITPLISLRHPAVLLCTQADYSETLNGKYYSWRQKAITLESFKLLDARRGIEEDIIKPRIQ